MPWLRATSGGSCSSGSHCSLQNILVDADHEKQYQTNSTAFRACTHILGVWNCNSTTSNHLQHAICVIIRNYQLRMLRLRCRCWRCGCGTRGQWRAAPSPSSRTWRRRRTGWGRRCGGCCSAARPPPGAADSPEGGAAESPGGGIAGGAVPLRVLRPAQLRVVEHCRVVLLRSASATRRS